MSCLQNGRRFCGKIYPQHGAKLDELNAANRTPMAIADNLPVDLAVDLLTKLITERGASKVLVMTTFDLDEYALSALRSGASGFLLKDTPPDHLVSALRFVSTWFWTAAIDPTDAPASAALAPRIGAAKRSARAARAEARRRRNPPQRRRSVRPSRSGLR